VQKEILRRARHRSVPVIIATQVLESMRLEGRPTRAEVNDAASAVEHGTDAIMLSGETASGLYPVRTVEVLADIIGDAESLPGRPEPPAAGAAGDHATALCDAAVRLAGETSAHAIVAVTREGRTARQLSALRPEAAIYALTDRDEVARRLALWWGVVPLVMSIEGDVDTVATRAIERIQHAGTLVPGATVVVVNATPDLDKGAANFLRVRRA
jgi:pyruvate kinase